MCDYCAIIIRSYCIVVNSTANNIGRGNVYAKACVKYFMYKIHDSGAVLFIKCGRNVVLRTLNTITGSYVHRDFIGHLTIMFQIFATKIGKVCVV